MLATCPRETGFPFRASWLGERELDLARYPQPVLASSTDGVGTKIAIAQALDEPISSFFDGLPLARKEETTEEKVVEERRYG